MSYLVMPAKAGIQTHLGMDPSLRWGDVME